MHCECTCHTLLIFHIIWNCIEYLLVHEKKNMLKHYNSLKSITFFHNLSVIISLYPNNSLFLQYKGYKLLQALYPNNGLWDASAIFPHILPVQSPQKREGGWMGEEKRVLELELENCEEMAVWRFFKAFCLFKEQKI